MVGMGLGWVHMNMNTSMSMSIEMVGMMDGLARKGFTSAF